MQHQKKTIEIKSKTKEEAVKEALKELGLEEKDIEVNVIQNPSKGFLGNCQRICREYVTKI